VNLVRESTPPRCRVPIGFAALTTLLTLAAAPLVAQAGDRMPATADFHSEPGGTALGSLAKNAAVSFGRERSGWREVTVRGWVRSGSLRPDARDGFDVSATDDNTPVRTAPEADAPVRASVRLGVLFDRLSTRNGWTEVRRTAWTRTPAPAETAPVQKSAPTPTPAAPPPAPPPAAGATPTVGDSARADSGFVALLAGSAFSAEAGGAPIGQIEATRRTEVIDHKDGWSRVVLDVWVKDGALGGAPAPGGVTGREVRESPDRYVGQTVEWSLQVLAVQQADELRPELPLGQPYVLARGPLPETGFVYLLIPSAEVATWRALEPLTEVRVRATVKAGRTRYLPTPVLDLVRRLD
jgi:hypothetical protein